jgi:hypothetical protein
MTIAITKRIIIIGNAKIPSIFMTISLTEKEGILCLCFIGLAQVIVEIEIDCPSR